MRQGRYIWPVLWACVMVGCNRGPAPVGGERLLPGSGHLPSPETFDWQVTASDTTDPVLEAWAGRLRQARLQWQRGKLVGEDPYSMFGRVWDVEIDQEGNVLVLDFINQEIRVFDRSGTFLTTVGHQGEGPGEFMQAGHLLLDANDSLYIYDNSRMMFLVYHNKLDTLYDYKRYFLIGRSGDSFCLIKDNIFIYKTTEKNAEFKAINLSGEPVWEAKTDGYYRKTITGNPENDAFIYSIMTQANISCSKKFICIAYSFYPILDIYDAYEKRLLFNIWISNVYITPQVFEPERVSIANFRTEGFIQEYNYSGIIDNYPSALFLNDDILLYQFIRYEAQKGEVVRAYPVAYLLDLRRRKARRLLLTDYPFASILAVRDTILVGQRWDLLQADVPHIAYYTLPSEITTELAP